MLYIVHHFSLDAICCLLCMDIFLIQTNLQILYIKSTNFTDLHGLTFESQENCIYHGNIHIYGKWAVPFVQRLIDNDFNLNNSFLDD